MRRPEARPGTRTSASALRITTVREGSKRVRRRCSAAKSSKRTLAGMGEKRLFRARWTSTARCSAVTSLEPASTFGPAARSAVQSIRSSIRCPP